MKIIINFLILLTCIKSYSQEIIQVKYHYHLKMPAEFYDSGMPLDMIKKYEAGYPGNVLIYMLEYQGGRSSFYYSKKVKSPDVDNLQITPFDVNKDQQKTYKTPSLSDKTIFQVSESLTSTNWKTDYTKKSKILGHQVVKATLKTEPGVVAWFAPTVPIFDGPDIYGGLPGLILKVETNFMAWEATEIINLPSSCKGAPTPGTFHVVSENEWKTYLSKNRNLFLSE